MIPAGAFRESIPRFLAPIKNLLADPSVSEIMINGPVEIWIERNGILDLTSLRFGDGNALQSALTNISQYMGRPLDALHPILEATLPDGSRVEAVLSPIAKGGPIVSIRKFSRSTLTMERLVKLDSLSKGAALFLENAIGISRNVIISGGTGTGKTSLLGAFSSFVGENERLVVIEDTHEIQIQRPHVVYLESRSQDERGKGRVSIRDLLAATLRLRPDRIIVGEVRGAEALDMIQAMTSGHGGSMTTVHASCSGDAVRRLETMALMADTALPLTALRAQIASAADIIVQAERTATGKRQVSAIDAVKGTSADGNYVIRKLFARDRQGRLFAVKRVPKKV